MNEKGQALVEFVLILPVMILVFLCLIDIGSIFLEKYDLNNDLEVVTELYQNNNSDELKSYIAKENLKYEATREGMFTNIMIGKSIMINAPILSNVLGKKYVIEAKKKVYNE